VVRDKPRLHVYHESLDPKVRAKNPTKYQGVSDHTILMDLYRVLPNIIIKVRPLWPCAYFNLTTGAQGIHQCARAVISKDNGPVELLVEGQGLKQVMVTPGVVGKETKSNHIMEVEKVLGIEAARMTIVKEISHTMSEHGLTVDPRHLGLLADTMTIKVRNAGCFLSKLDVLCRAKFWASPDSVSPR
jgi:DNA-directed RNA polymerase beta' subunit